MTRRNVGNGGGPPSLLDSTGWWVDKWLPRGCCVIYPIGLIIAIILMVMGLVFGKW